jgi:hypothetical protein
VSRQLQAEAVDTENKMYLRLAVAEGGDEDTDVSFDLSVTMSNLAYILEVEHAGKKVTEILDLRDLVQEWVASIVKDIDSKEALE